jgi:hypothetical protein
MDMQTLKYSSLVVSNLDPTSGLGVKEIGEVKSARELRNGIKDTNHD